MESLPFESKIPRISLNKQTYQQDPVKNLTIIKKQLCNSKTSKLIRPTLLKQSASNSKMVVGKKPSTKKEEVVQAQFVPGVNRLKQQLHKSSTF